MKIAVGTTSSWKIKYLDEVLSEMGVEVELETFGVESGVPEQPIGEELVKKGSVNRAKNALNESGDCDLSLGIEVGYVKNEDKIYEMFCYATAMNHEHQISRSSSKLVLPNFFQELLEKGDYLGDHVVEYEKQDHHPSSLYLARVVRYREPFIKEAVRNTLLIFLHKEEF